MDLIKNCVAMLDNTSHFLLFFSPWLCSLDMHGLEWGRSGRRYIGDRPFMDDLGSIKRNHCVPSGIVSKKREVGKMSHLQFTKRVQLTVTS